MRAALEQRNGDELCRIAHSAKGTLANFSAPQAASAAHELQETARGGQWNQVGDSVDRLEVLMQQVARELPVA